MAFHPQVPQLGTVGQTQLTGTSGPLVELVATVEMIKNRSCRSEPLSPSHSQAVLEPPQPPPAPRHLCQV